MMSQVDEVVALSDVSFNTELEVIRKLSVAAKETNRIHGVILMVERGDLREGIMPALLEKTVRAVLGFSNIIFMGIGTNLACRSGVSPDRHNMAKLSGLANAIDATFGPIVTTVSGGNSANLEWALRGADTGRVNDLCLGEAMLLGCEPLNRQQIKGLSHDEFMRGWVAIFHIAPALNADEAEAEDGGWPVNWAPLATEAFRRFELKELSREELYPHLSGLL